MNGTTWEDNRQKNIKEDKGECPICSKEEDNNHVFECKKNKLKTTWEEMNKVLTKLETSPPIKIIMKTMFQGIKPGCITVHNKHDELINIEI